MSIDACAVAQTNRPGPLQVAKERVIAARSAHQSHTCRRTDGQQTATHTRR